MQQHPQVTRTVIAIPTEIISRMFPHLPNISSIHFVIGSVIPELSASSSDSEVSPSSAFVVVVGDEGTA